MLRPHKALASTLGSTEVDPILLRGVTARYPDRPPVLTDLDLTVGRGERVAVRGVSGSGKTTLLNVIRGVHSPDCGEVYLLGEQVYPDSQARTSARRGPRQASIPHSMRRVGLVQQRPVNIDTLSVADNAILPALSLGKRPDLERLVSLFVGFGLPTEILTDGTSAGNLSVGQQVRLSVVASLMCGPELLLMDEPTAALDPANREAFSNQLTAVCEKLDTTAFVITHDELPGFATRSLSMYGGHLHEGSARAIA